jgi:hypothetical protein
MQQVDERRPTFFDGGGEMTQHAFVPERQFAAAFYRNNVDLNEARLRPCSGYAQGENETARPFDFEIFAEMIAVFAIAAYDKKKLATHPGIDVGSDNILFSGMRE